MSPKAGYSALLLLLALSSCTYNMYVPSTANVPTFEKKNQLTATVAGRNLQLAYAATSHIGFTLNGYYRPQKIFHLYDGKEDGHRNHNEGLDGAVAFFKVSPKSINEILVGYGQGYTAFTYTEYMSQGQCCGGSANFRKYYFQYDLVLLARRQIKWAITTKLDFVTLYNFRDVQNNPIPDLTSSIFTPGLSLVKKAGRVSIMGRVEVPLPSNEKHEFSVYWGRYPAFQEMLMLNLGIVIHILDPTVKED